MDGGRPVVKRVLRSASNSLKRKSALTPPSEKVKLAKILGLTVSNNAALDTDSNTGTIAYPAGCVVVLYNCKKNKQSHIFNTCKKTITSMAFSRDGKYLVTGESGHQPAVRVWDLEDLAQAAEFLGHKFGVNCVSFSPNLKYIISVGTQHDMVINVWNWRANSKLASNKVANNVQDMDFSEDGSYFVTVGNRHVKFWYLDASKSRATVNETVPLMGRAGILGEQRNNWFCGVACGKGCISSKTFVITQGGLLCEFNEKRLLDKWVELRTSRASAIVVSEKYIYIGCADGVVRIFSCLTLHYIASLPRPHHLGIDVATGLDPSHIIAPPPEAKYPDTIAISFDEEAQKMTCVYADNSMYVWDVRDIKRVGKTKSFLYHSACIWGLDVYPDVPEKRALPEGSFITCSSDNTIRVWNVNPGMDTDTNYKRNIYSSELLKVIYTDTDLSSLTEQNTGSTTSKQSDKGGENASDKIGMRSVRISPDGELLASGDRQGNIRVHELKHMEQIQMLEAHNSDVLALEFTPPQCGVNLLASAGRDRLLHVFDRDQDFGLIQTLDDHSASITAVKFTQQDDSLNMLSCGADKSLLFRNAQMDPEFQFVLDKHLVSKTTFYDMDVDPTHKFAATACQDRNIRIYNLKNSKQKKCYAGSIGSDGTLIRLGLDASGSYAVTSCSDKNLCVVDFFTGEVLGSMYGHSEVVTGIKVMNDLKHVVSVAGDGCIFVWRLPVNLTEQAQARQLELKEKSHLSNGDVVDGEWSVSSEVSNKDVSSSTKSAPVLDNNANIPRAEPDYSFNVGQLPAWAKKQVLQEADKGPSGPLPNAQAPRGKWAQRLGNAPITIKSVMDDSNLNLCMADCMDRRRYTVEPETLKNQVDSLRRETMIMGGGRKANVPIITDDDIDNVDEEEDDDFKPALEGEQIHKHEQRLSVFRPGSRQSLHVTHSSELEDREEENPVIYYPATDQEPDSPDAMARSFQVYEGDNTSVKDLGSEGTEPTSVEDTSDEESNASTPLDSKDFATPDQEKFVKDHFESMALKDSFNTTLADLDTDITGGHGLHGDDAFTHRLSISTRFLSRGQQQHLRQAMGHSTPISASTQRKRDEVSKAVEDTRKRLHALGWRPGGEENDQDPAPSYNRQQPPPSPTTPGKNGDASRARSTSARRKPEPGSERRKTVGDIRQDSPPRLSKPPPSPSTTTTPERKRWSTSTPTPGEDDGPGAGGSGGMRRWQSMLDMAGGRTTPTHSKSPRHSAPRSKTPLSYSLSAGRTLPQTPTQQSKYATKMEIRLDSNSSGSAGVSSGARLGDRATSRTRSEKNLATAVDMTETNRRRSSKPSYMQHTSSSNSKLMKAGSSLGLNKSPAELVPATTAAPSGPPKVSTNRRSGPPKKGGRLSSSMKAKFQSTPNLAELSTKDDDDDSDVLSQVVDDMGKLRGSPEKSLSAFKSPVKRDMMAPRESKVPHTNDNGTMPSDNTSEVETANKEERRVKSVWKRVSPVFKPEDIAHEYQREGEPDDSLNVTTHSNHTAIEDSLAMPPPATTDVPNSSRLAQITHDARSTPAEITLAQAKDILLGKSQDITLNQAKDILMGKSAKGDTLVIKSAPNSVREVIKVSSSTSTKPAPPLNMSSYPAAPWRSVYSSTTATSLSSTASISIAKPSSSVQYNGSNLAASDLDETPVKDDSVPTRERSVVDMTKSRLRHGSSSAFVQQPGSQAFSNDSTTTTSTTSVFREPMSSSRSGEADSRREGEPDDLPMPLRPRSATGVAGARSATSTKDASVSGFQGPLEPADCGDVTPDNDCSVPVEQMHNSSPPESGDKPKVTVLSRNRENILNSLFSSNKSTTLSSGQQASAAKSETVSSHSRTSSGQGDASESTPTTPKTHPARMATKSSITVPSSPLNNGHPSPRVSPRRRVPTTPSSPAAITARSQWEQTFKDHKLRKQQLQQMDHLPNGGSGGNNNQVVGSVQRSLMESDQPGGGSRVVNAESQGVALNQTDVMNTAGNASSQPHPASAGVTVSSAAINGTASSSSSKKPSLHLSLQNVHQPNLPIPAAKPSKLNHTETSLEMLKKAVKDLTKSSNRVVQLLAQVDASEEGRVGEVRQITAACDQLYSAVGVGHTDTSTTLSVADRVYQLLEHKLSALTPTETQL